MNIIRRLLCLLVLSSTPINGQEDVASPWNQRLRTIEQYYSSFSVVAFIEERTQRGSDAPVKSAYTIEYRRTGDRQKLVKRFLNNSGPVEMIYVSNPDDVSFIVSRDSSRAETVRFLSSRRGIGADVVSDDITDAIPMLLAFISYYGDSYADMMSGGRLAISKEEVTPSPPGKSEVYRVDQMIPEFTKRKVGDVFSHFFGQMTISPESGCVEAFSLRSKRTDGIDTGVVNYSVKLAEKEGVPTPQYAEWTVLEGERRPVDLRMTLKDISFGSPHPDDFTLEGSGVRIINTSGASSKISLLAWYSGMILVMSLVALWLIRKRQRSAA